MGKIGFIGIGIMGKPMCKNLIDSGYKLVVNDVNEEALNDFVKYGAKKQFTQKCSRK